METPLSKKIFAEFFGTLVLVLMGCGANNQTYNLYF